MIRRGWNPAEIARMTNGDFQYWLGQAAEAAKEEAEAIKKAAQGK